MSIGIIDTIISNYDASPLAMRLLAFAMHLCQRTKTTKNAGFDLLGSERRRSTSLIIWLSYG
jgi:hypothetical protein